MCRTFIVGCECKTLCLLHQKLFLWLCLCYIFYVTFLGSISSEKGVHRFYRNMLQCYRPNPAYTAGSSSWSGRQGVGLVAAEGL